MARVEVGAIVYRNSDGNFLPQGEPVFRSLSEERQTPSERPCRGSLPLSRRTEQELYELLADKYKEYRRVLRRSAK